MQSDSSSPHTISLSGWAGRLGQAWPFVRRLTRQADESWDTDLNAEDSAYSRDWDELPGIEIVVCPGWEWWVQIYVWWCCWHLWVSHGNDQTQRRDQSRKRGRGAQVGKPRSCASYKGSGGPKRLTRASCEDRQRSALIEKRIAFTWPWGQPWGPNKKAWLWRKASKQRIDVAESYKACDLQAGEEVSGSR